MATIKRALPPAPAPTRPYRTEEHTTSISTVHIDLAEKQPKNRRHRTFTNAEKAEILKLRDGGKQYSYIARLYDTTSDTIRHIVCRENKKRAGSAATPTAQSNEI